MPNTASLLRSVTGGPDREIGPIGTASRAVGGLIAIVTAGYERYAPESLARRHSICSGPACVLGASVVGVAIALTIATPVSDVALLSFVGVSMLVAALRGYAGC